MSSLRVGIWVSGVGAWAFGILERSFAALADGYPSALDLILISTAALIAVGWLFLIPEVLWKRIGRN